MKIIVEVEISDTDCDQCDFMNLSTSWCELFQEGVAEDDNYLPMPCDSCQAARNPILIFRENIHKLGGAQNIYKKGEKVEITASIAGTRRGRVYGTITSINGEYHLVRIENSNREVELYRNELKKYQL